MRVSSSADWKGAALRAHVRRQGLVEHREEEDRKDETG